MSNTLLESLQAFLKNQIPTPFDPSVLQDPLALKTAWTALKSGGTNFRTHRLVQPHSGRLEFKPTITAYVFYSIFILVGAGLLAAFPLEALFSPGAGSEDKTAIFFCMLMGTVFISIGIFMAYTGTSPIVFDQMRVLFWKGRPREGGRISRESFTTACELSRIHALQIIAEHCRGSKSSYYSYELNLVLDDASRLNVVDHGALRAMKRDAAKLAGFLNVPVWDQTQREPLYSPLSGNEQTRSNPQVF